MKSKPYNISASSRLLALCFATVLLALLLTFNGCANTVRYDRHRAYLFPKQQAKVFVEYSATTHRDSELISDLLPSIMQHLGQVGQFRYPVLIRIIPTHTELEQQVHRSGYPWLRAWARFDVILLQAPSTWAGVMLQTRVKRLLTHELAHVLMYQTIGEGKDWYKKPIPLWFREGMASYIADQGDSRMSRHDLQKYYLGEDYAGDPISEGHKLVQQHPREVYSVGHWMFEDLVEQAGMDQVLKMLAMMREDLSFREAFRSQFAVTESEYEQNWRETLLAAEFPQKHPSTTIGKSGQPTPATGSGNFESGKDDSPNPSR